MEPAVLESSITTEYPPLPVNPSKSPAPKKKASEVASALEEKFEHTSAELKTVTDKVTKLEHKLAHAEQSLKQMRQKFDALEMHSRCCNLRLMGVPETAEEDVCSRVTAICQEVLPNNRDRMADYIDVGHRLLID